MVVSTLFLLLSCLALQLFISATGPTAAAFIKVLFQLTFETQPHIAIDDLTQHAFAVLGKNGEIPGAREHTCSECPKPFE